MEFISLLRPKRPDFTTTMTPEEKEVMGRHMAYAGDLFNRGTIVFGGAATDGAIGVLVFRADSLKEARRIFDNDPAVLAGIGYPELHPFHIGLMPGDKRK